MDEKKYVFAYSIFEKMRYEADSGDIDAFCEKVDVSIGSMSNDDASYMGNIVCKLIRNWYQSGIKNADKWAKKMISLWEFFSAQRIYEELSMVIEENQIDTVWLYTKELVKNMMWNKEHKEFWDTLEKVVSTVSEILKKKGDDHFVHEIISILYQNEVYDWIGYLYMELLKNGEKLEKELVELCVICIRKTSLQKDGIIPAIDMCRDLANMWYKKAIREITTYVNRLVIMGIYHDDIVAGILKEIRKQSFFLRFFRFFHVSKG